jgi:hypothetical protein
MMRVKRSAELGHFMSRERQVMFAMLVRHFQVSCPAQSGHPVRGGVSMIIAGSGILDRPPSRAMERFDV